MLFKIINTAKDADLIDYVETLRAKTNIDIIEEDSGYQIPNYFVQIFEVGEVTDISRILELLVIVNPVYSEVPVLEIYDSYRE